MNFKKYYNFLIKIGNQGAIGEPDIILYNNLIAEDNAPIRGDLKCLSELNNDEILLLFRGFVILENEIGGDGSVSAGIQIYENIQNRMDVITDWALINARNPYIPFGSAGNLRGNNLSDHKKRNLAYAHTKTIESINADLTLKNKKINGLENKIIQLEKEKLYFKSILSYINEEDVLKAKKIEISKRKNH
jgi:hypothetical protein